MPDFMQGVNDGINPNKKVVDDALNGFGLGITANLTDTFKTAMFNIMTIVSTFYGKHADSSTEHMEQYQEQH